MIRLYNTQGVPAYPLADIENFCVVHTFEGDDSLSFDISPKHPLYPNIAEEIKLEYGDNIFVIKGINERTDRSTISASLDLDRFRDSFFPLYEPSSPVTITEVLRKVLPSSFTILGDIDFSQTRPLKLERATGLDLLNACQEAFGVVYQWNLKEQTVTLIDPTAQSSRGTYLTDELNLESVSFKGDSQNFITRLYPFGKDGLGIESSGDGLPYVENFTYSDRILCGFWSDTSFEDSDALRQAAVEKLKGLCMPQRSYECSVIDLAKLNPDYYSELTFALYDVVTLLDRNRNTRVDHQIVEYKEYPDEPRRNVITLSNKTKTIKNTISSTIKDIITEVDSTKTDLQTAIEKATQAITGNSGGYVVLYPPEHPEEILILDEPSIEQARNVWRWNKEGLGHSSTGYDGEYALAILADGKINANFITTGQLSASLIHSGVLQAQLGNTQINLNDGTFQFGGDKLVLENGKLTMRGTINSTDGNIGGWSVSGSGFTAQSSRTGICPDNTYGGIAFWAGSSGTSIGTAPVQIYHSGEFICRYISLDRFGGDLAIEQSVNSGIVLRCPGYFSVLSNKGLIVANFANSRHMPVYASAFLNATPSNLYSSRSSLRDALSIVMHNAAEGPSPLNDESQSVPNPANYPPEVMDETGEYLSLGNMSEVLWRAIQQQQQVIENLEQRISVLEQG